MEETTATRLPRPARRRWPRVLGIILLIVALLGLLYWWRMPKRLLRIATLTGAQDRSLSPFTTGFFYQTGDSSFAMRRWNGKPYWQITVLQPGQGSYVGAGQICVSPDGKYCAAIGSEHNTTVLYTWHEGHLQDTCRLPHIKAGIPWTVVTLDNGRVWLYCSEQPGTKKSVTHLCLVKGREIMARGSFPGEGCLSPDGRSFLRYTAPTSLAEVIVADGTIRLGKLHPYRSLVNLDIYGLIGSYTLSSFYAQGVVMSEDCKVYDTAGHIKRPAPGWERDETVSPGSRYTLLLKDNQVRAFSPITGDNWQLHPQGFSNRGGDITDDGRFVMLWCEREYPAALEALLYRLPIDIGQPEYLVFFERPGRMRALCRRQEAWSSWWISPDGHTMVTQEDGTGNISLYRW